MKLLTFAKDVVASDDLHSKQLAGVKQLADAVGSTLGPRGRNVVIDRHGDQPITTKDGVTVSRHIQLPDPIEQASVKMVQSVAKDVVEEAGDGTTTATILAYQIFKEGLACLSQDVGAIQLQRSLLHAAANISAAIRTTSKPATDAQLAHVATIATNGNTGISEMILAANKAVGRDGVITMTDSKDDTTYLEICSGFRFRNGFTSPDFITDRQKNLCVLENPLIFMTEKLLTQGVNERGNPYLHDLGPLLMYALGVEFQGGKPIQVREPRPLLIIAEDVVGDALTVLLTNQNPPSKTLEICIVRAPGAGELRRAALADMAMATGGEVLKQDGGLLVSTWVKGPKGTNTGERLGTCARAIISNSETILEGCAGDEQDPELIQRFAANLVKQAEECPDAAGAEQLRHRAGRLTGAVAVIHVGASTEAEARPLRDAVEDAVLAVRAAAAEGVVPGGGLCLLALGLQLALSTQDMGAEQSLGATLLARCLQAPVRQIAANAGEDPDRVVANIIDYAQKHKGALTHGYNAATGEYVDMVAAGIIDPAKVVRVALEKAASVAATMLTSSCMITFLPINQPALPAPPINERMR